jgi:hypothetical protein
MSASQTPGPGVAFSSRYRLIKMKNMTINPGQKEKEDILWEEVFGKVLKDQRSQVLETTNLKI